MGDLPWTPETKPEFQLGPMLGEEEDKEMQFSTPKISETKAKTEKL